MLRQTATSLLSFGAVALLTSGCLGISINKKQKAAQQPDGFVFGSTDSGAIWKQSAVLLRPGANALSLANAAVTTLVVDPTDPNAMYAGTPDRGLLYSFTGGRDWQATLENQGAISSVGVDPLNHCILYVAIGSTLQKSIDCARNWQRLVVTAGTTGKSANAITNIAVDDHVAGHLLAATSNGELHSSNDAGNSWSLLYKFKRGISRMVVNPNDSRIIYAAVNNDTLWRTADGGVTWQDVAPRDPNDSKLLKILHGAAAFRDIAIDYTVRDGLYYASDAGLHRSDDGGVSWSATTLPVTLDSRVHIGQIAVDSTNTQRIFMAVGSRLASTVNGGESWTWHDLPSKRPLVEMLLPLKSPYLFTGFGPAVQ
jgi:photosystem II stability/assembly factor-like uncharacterized protein